MTEIEKGAELPRGHHAAVFALESGRTFAEDVCAHLAVPLGRHEERDFEDGEHKTRALEPVRGRDVYLVQSLHAGGGYSANDKLVRLLFFAASLRDAGAERVTCITPYLAYSRKDRRTKLWDPVSSRYIACLFESLAVDRVVTIDVHNVAAYQNAFRIPAEHLTAARELARVVRVRLGDAEAVVVSPDAGGAKRAEAFRTVLEAQLGRPVGLAFMEKFRSQGVVRGGTVVGDVQGRVAVVVDDLVASGGTLARAAVACKQAGAVAAYAVVTHGVFSDGSEVVLRDDALAGLIVTDTIDPSGRLPDDLLEDRVHVVSCARLVATTVRQLHTGAALEDLAEEL